MRKILNFGCSSIAYNDKYICAAGNIIVTLNRDDFKEKHHISGYRNIISLDIDSQYIYAKNTSGQYFLFDLETGSLITKGKCVEKENSSNDYIFFRTETGVILDILVSKSGDTYAVKYDLLKNSYEKLYLTDNNFRCKNYILNGNKAYLLFIEKCFINKEKPKCIYFQIDLKSMKIIKETTFSLEHSDNPLALVSPNFILTEGKEIIDINTLEKYPTRLKEYFKNNDLGYKYRIIPKSSESIILVYSKEVLVYNLNLDKIICNFKCEKGDCCSCAEIIDSNLYVGTWSGFFVATPENNGIVKNA